MALITAGMPRVWTPKETFNLIRLWKAFPCLWLKGSKDYRNKAKKETAIRKIASSLNIDPPEIVRKTHNLRCGMNTELRKARAKAAKGLVYQSPWAYYRALMFIADEIPVPNPNAAHQANAEFHDSGSGNSDERSTDWPTIVARYGNANFDDQDAVFPQPMDLNGGLFESLAEAQGMQYYAQADYDNGDGSMGVPNDDDLIEEESAQEIPDVQSDPSQCAGASDEDSVQEIPRPSVNLTPKPIEDINKARDAKTYPPQVKKHHPDSVPFAEEYTILGDFICSEMRQMRSMELRKHLKSMIQRVITDTSREDDMEYSLSTSGTSNGSLPERTHFDKSSLDSEEDQTPFGKFVAMRLKEIRSDERRRRLKRTIQRFMLDMSEEDDMEYSIADTDRDEHE